MKKIFLSFIAIAAMNIPAMAIEPDTEQSEFISDEVLEEGFLTHYLNEAIANGMNTEAKSDEVKYGRTVTDYVSAPKFGGYFIGKYDYSSRDGLSSNNGFSQRLVRFYVDGKILKDFTYRIQVQTNNASFHMKDFFVEWGRYSEFKVKIGQYKRAFGFENPMNPWDVGVGDYSQLTKKLTGHSDYIGSESGSNGGRDQGLQIQGDVLPVGKDGHKLLHYQVMVANGQGINAADANSNKDLMATLQVQPISGLTIGVFGWTGKATYNGISASKDRYMISGRYEKKGWTARAEYAHSTGHKIADYAIVDGSQVLKATASNGRADAWYATLGIPCTDWLKTYVKYDVYRDDASWNTTKSIYSVCPNIQLHKNLMFQIQYNYVHDRNLSKKNYHELWAETYVRF